MKATAALLVPLFLVQATCGTRDYEAEPDVPDTLTRPARIPASPLTGGGQPGDPSIARSAQPYDEKEYPGYFWSTLRWIQVPDESLNHYQDLLRDDSGTNSFRAFGVALTGGAVLGVVIRGSGSWFLGGPVESKANHWFWQKTNLTGQTLGQGLTRGAAFSGACYLLLSGVRPLPYDGLLGTDYKALSTSLAIAATSGIAAARPLMRLISAEWPRTQGGGGLSGKAAAFAQWTNNSMLGWGLRYRVVPGIILVGVSAGVGVLVYDYLQD